MLTCRWERSGFDMAHGKLSEQLQIISAEANAVAASTEVAHAAERHATAEAELLRAQGDAEQVSQCTHSNLMLLWCTHDCINFLCNQLCSNLPDDQASAALGSIKQLLLGFVDTLFCGHTGSF